MRRPLLFKVYMLPCARCGGRHAWWWKSTPPPSCEERRLRNKVNDPEK